MFPPTDAVSSQDRAAQTRIKNDQQRANTAQIASQSVRGSLAKTQSGPPVHMRQNNSAPQQVQSQQSQPQQQGSVVPQSASGPQPVGELGQFLKSISQQNSQQAYAMASQSPVEGEPQINMEEFLQSPALQEAMARSKLAQYFSRRPPDTSTYANTVLENMSRYQ